MTDENVGDAPEAEQEPEQFENRAARRAKGKKGGHQGLGSTGEQHMHSSSVQSPRQYGTRRSG